MSKVYRYHCKHTELPTRSTVCKKCGCEYTYVLAPNASTPQRETCDECCTPSARQHRKLYTEQINDAMYLTSDNSAVLLASCLEDDRNPMDIEDVAEMTGKDVRDWQIFYDWMCSLGIYQKYARMVRGKRTDRTGGEVDFLGAATQRVRHAM